MTNPSIPNDARFVDLTKWKVLNSNQEEKAEYGDWEVDMSGVKVVLKGVAG
jgi:hypothetical protein